MFGPVTRKLVGDGVITNGDAPHFDAGSDAPRRITLKNLKLGITIYFNLVDYVSLGRENPTQSDMPHIDLEPYNAERLGISRAHAILKLEEGKVFIADNNSANGVCLNQQLLRPLISYRVHHGDIIRLAGMILQISFPRNSFGDLLR